MTVQPQLHNGTSIYCDCHGNERLLDVQPRVGLHVIDGRHGVKHEARVAARELLERLAGTVSGSAIVTYVSNVVGRNGHVGS